MVLWPHLGTEKLHPDKKNTGTQETASRTLLKHLKLPTFSFLWMLCCCDVFRRGFRPNPIQHKTPDVGSFCVLPVFFLGCRVFMRQLLLPVFIRFAYLFLYTYKNTATCLPTRRPRPPPPSPLHLHLHLLLLQLQNLHPNANVLKMNQLRTARGLFPC